MKRETRFLQVVVILIGIPILGLCSVLLPLIATNAEELAPGFVYLRYPSMIVMYATAIPFFGALYQTLKLLNYIDKNNAFSELSVKALKNIKLCAMSISGLYVIGLPFLFIMAEADDAPGLAGIGLVVVFASLVVAVFAAVLQKLLKSALDIKEENDLTV